MQTYKTTKKENLFELLTDHYRYSFHYSHVAYRLICAYPFANYVVLSFDVISREDKLQIANIRCVLSLIDEVWDSIESQCGIHS